MANIKSTTKLNNKLFKSKSSAKPVAHRIPDLNIKYRKNIKVYASNVHGRKIVRR